MNNIHGSITLHSDRKMLRTCGLLVLHITEVQSCFYLLTYFLLNYYSNINEIISYVIFLFLLCNKSLQVRFNITLKLNANKFSNIRLAKLPDHKGYILYKHMIINIIFNESSSFLCEQQVIEITYYKWCLGKESVCNTTTLLLC